MSSNLLKLGGKGVARQNTRVIDTNQLMLQRMEALSIKMNPVTEPGGFSVGIKAEEIDISSLVDQEGEEESNVIKQQEEISETTEALERKALEEANAILADAQNKADEMIKQAQREREMLLEESRRQGYEEGVQQAKQELEQERRRLRQKEADLQKEYDEMIDRLEPEFVEHLTGIYEHIFRVDFSTNREVLEYLINTTVRKIENSKNFLLHVSKDDYPYVSMRKQQLMGGAGFGDASMEIIEDITLSRNECLIETENGVFDCSLGTQLAELSKKLKLLAYQNG